MIDLNRLEELEKAATPGPWQTSGQSLRIPCESSPTGFDRPIEIDTSCDGRSGYNLDLIAELRNCAPALIAEVKAARAWLKAYDKSGSFTYIDMNIEVLAELEKACDAYRKLVEQNTREVGDDV